MDILQLDQQNPKVCHQSQADKHHFMKALWTSKQDCPSMGTVSRQKALCCQCLPRKSISRQHSASVEDRLHCCMLFSLACMPDGGLTWHVQACLVATELSDLHLHSSQGPGLCPHGLEPHGSERSPHCSQPAVRESDIQLSCQIPGSCPAPGQWPWPLYSPSPAPYGFRS